MQKKQSRLYKTLFLFTVILGTMILLFKQMATIQDRRPATTQSTKIKPFETGTKITSNQVQSLSEEEVLKLIHAMRVPSDYEKIQHEIIGYPEFKKNQIYSKLLKIIYPIKDLKTSLRALNLLILILKENSQKNPHLALPLIKELLNENNPIVTRYALRVLGEIPNEESALILSDSLNAEDSSISTEAMTALEKIAKYNPDFFKEKTYDDEVIQTYLNFKRHEQDNLEIQSQTLHTLAAIGDQEAFQFLIKSLFANDTNLELKNQIAVALPKWGKSARPYLEKYLAYLKTLKVEEDSLVDQDRSDGLVIVRRALTDLK